MIKEALALADYLDNNVEAMYSQEQQHIDRASDMIRNLVAELDKQGEPVVEFVKSTCLCGRETIYPFNTAPQTNAEPIGWKCVAPPCKCDSSNFKQCGYATYTAPQTKPLSDDEIIETLAEIEHEQWMTWADSIMKTEKISDNRFARWASLMIPYAELSEEMKEHDRVWARKVIRAIEKAHGIK